MEESRFSDLKTQAEHLLGAEFGEFSKVRVEHSDALQVLGREVGIGWYGGVRPGDMVIFANASRISWFSALSLQVVACGDVH